MNAFGMSGAQKVNMDIGVLNLTDTIETVNDLLLMYAKYISEDCYEILAGMPDKMKHMSRLELHRNPKYEADKRFPVNWMQEGFVYDTVTCEFRAKEIYSIRKSEIKRVGSCNVKFTKVTRNDGTLSHVLCCIHVKPLLLVQYNRKVAT